MAKNLMPYNRAPADLARMVHRVVQEALEKWEGENFELQPAPHDELRAVGKSGRNGTLTFVDIRFEVRT
jgi:hypothetical protein